MNTRPIDQASDPKRVFIVHGRNEEAKKAMKDLLYAFGLRPLDWNEMVTQTGTAAPEALEVLAAAFSQAQAVIVLLTGDDCARIGRRFGKEKLTPQPRPNVLFEAGMALGLYPRRTIFVQIGPNRAFNDIAGKHYVEMDGSTAKRIELVNLLKAAGCPIDTSASDGWATRGDFARIPRSPDGKDTTVEVSKSTLAVLAMLFALFVYASLWLRESSGPRKLRIVGDIETLRPITIYIVGIPNFQYTLQKSDKFSTTIPVLPNFEYRAEYVADGRIVADRLVPLEGSTANLGHFVNEISTLPTEQIKPEIKVSDDDVRRFLARQ